MHYSHLLAIVAAGAALVAGAPVEKKSVENLDKRFRYTTYDGIAVEKRTDETETLDKRFYYNKYDGAPLEGRSDEIEALDKRSDFDYEAPLEKRFYYNNYEGPLDKRFYYNNYEGPLDKRFYYNNYEAPFDKRSDETEALTKRFYYNNYEAPFDKRTEETEALAKRFYYNNYEAPFDKRAEEVESLDKRFYYNNYERVNDPLPYHDQASNEIFLFGKSLCLYQPDICDQMVTKSRIQGRRCLRWSHTQQASYVGAARCQSLFCLSRHQIRRIVGGI